MAKVRLAVAAIPILCGALAACDDTTELDSSGFEDLEEQSEDLYADLRGEPLTDPAALPTTGTASYDGVMLLDLAAIENGPGESHDLAGEMAITANFATLGDPITGSVTDFVGADGQDYSGGLSISGGDIDREADPKFDPTYTAALGGEISSEDGQDHEIQAYLLGQFAGEEPDHTYGSVFGGATTDGEAAGVTGEFVAERTD